MFREAQFKATLGMNANFYVQCQKCGSGTTLKKAHEDKWVYRDRLEGHVLKRFLCNKCYGNIEEIKDKKDKV